MSLDNMETSQATVYLVRGLSEECNKRGLLQEETGLKYLSEDDEGIMSVPSAIARIAIEAVRIYMTFEDEPPNDMTVFEDLMNESLPALITSQLIVEAMNSKSRTRADKWSWFVLLLDKFITDWYNARDFDLQNFMEETWKRRYKIQVEYFKPSGKFYSEAYFYTEKECWLDVVDELNYLLKNDPPGLLVFDEQFMVYMNSDEHPMGFPIIRNPVGN